MDQELTQVIGNSSLNNHKKIIIALLVIIQTLGVFILSSGYKRFTALEEMDNIQAEEIERLQTDAAVIKNKIDNLQQQFDTLEAFYIGEPELRRNVKKRGKHANNS